MLRVFRPSLGCLPPARRPAQPPEVPGAESVRRVGVTR